MAASEKALIYGGDTHCALSSKLLRVVAAPKDSNYVDLNELLDLKLGERKAVQVSFTGQKDTLQCVRLPSGEHLPICVNLEGWENDRSEGATETKTAGSARLRHGNLKDCPEVLSEHESERTPENWGKKTEVLEDGDLQRTDSYLSEKSESDDEVRLVIADYCVHQLASDEAHYITTHEIQLSELDHDVDCDFETASTWDIDDDHQVYSFVDYASADSDEPTGVQEESNEDEAHRSTAMACSQAESDPGDRTRSATSDEKAPECHGKSTGHIHLSIKATSRAINKPSNVQEKDGGQHHHAIHTGDMSRCVLKDTKGEKVCDGAKCLIALPGRLHFGSKFKSKDVTGYSSGTSSAVSELDDADKEVRNLTARAFRSLAYPYLDAINVSTSSESSASERSKGLNRWSALVDLKYGNVNVSKGGGHNIVAHQSASSNIQLAKRRESKGITGLTLTSRRAPPVEIFALNGNLVNSKNASSTKKIELMGKIGQGQSGVIRLTEMLNFRCNVKAGPPANERRVKSARSAGGSRSADEVTNPRQKAHCKPPCNSEEAMEDVHKKSIFASSILKNVISKKMQFEQERKMERGEICEPGSHEHEAHRDKAALPGLLRQSSKLSETGSDFSIVCLDELGDIVDSGSCDARDNERHDGTLALASETSLESQNCAAFDTKKGAADASRGGLIRSQNSAFRSWKEEELEVETERKHEQTSETSSTLTKMSRLFVPSIQLVSGERELEKPEASAERNPEEMSGNTLYVSEEAAQNSGASKSPEIKISLRSLRDNRSDKFSIAKLLTPNTGCSAGGLMKTSDESKYQALAAALKSDSSDKIPHFTVRDVRDKAKLQAPIHQVRDVRKLVKSSYHFGSLDNNGLDTEHKTPKQNTSRNLTNLSPMVIKCQSVNTNSNAKQSEKFSDSSNHSLVEVVLEADGSQPQVDGINTGSGQISKSSDPVHLANIMQEETPAVKSETKNAAKKQEKVCDPGEKKADPKMTALEKLQAAVKTMEQLYVFDKKEWKRKSEPQPITDSHVLSLLSGEHHRGNEQDQGNTSSSSVAMRRDSFSNPDKIVTAGQQLTPKEEKETLKISHSPAVHDKRNDTKTLMHLGGTPTKKISSVSHSQKSFVPVTTSSVKAQQKHVSSSSASVSSIAVKNHKSQKLPVSSNITQSKPISEKREKLSSNTDKSNKAGFVPVQFTSSVDSENYITIPVKPYVTDAHQSHMIHSSNAEGHGDNRHPTKCSSTVMETRSPDTPTATIYHHPLPIAMHAAQPQVICFSPTVQPSPVPTDHFQTTQRKMLLDPTTGNYYLVDTPVQSATRRLYDPETGQYVDVPMPQQHPMTPVPVPISPLALSPGGYGHTYMLYPGYMASTVIPARTIQSQLSVQSEVEAGDKSHAGQHEDGAYMESPYYVPSGKSLQLTPGAQHVISGRVANSKVPVISISSQQGPRIIAPPSFDGTTMSFVVEHR